MNPSKTVQVAFRGTVGGFALDTAFTVPSNGVTALFGPSGCGKTTVLRCMAGLRRVADGFCAIDGEVWQDARSFTPTHRRAIGYVFQEPSLFPHLSVRRNLLYGRGKPGPADAFVFDEVADLLGLQRLLHRSTQHLSGGERQRVAIGRALLSQPKLLLMDEPLSALDQIKKDEILPFLERMRETFALPVIYVSHDMAEVERLADHLVLMASGRAIASGSLAALQSDPSLPLVATRDAAVSLDAVAESYDARFGLAAFRVHGGIFLVPTSEIGVGERRRLRILASDVSLVRDPPQRSTIVNVLPARILSASPVGEHEIVVVLGLGTQGSGLRLLARITRRSWHLLELAEGTDLYAQIKGVALASGRTAGP